MVSYHSTYHSLGCWLRPYAVGYFLAVATKTLLIYILFSPRSMEGGDLRWFWSHFEMFERIDHVSISSSTVQFYHSLRSRYTASKDIMTRQVLRLPLVSFVVRARYSAI